ncbi:unnamed protein product [Protopolystoma xenopodis]|uniref:Uncharacterized protein n=1 Tax=Protopolystoma xenopodis TaxID=117903 RepID=A0A3S5FFX6_9PLAT|nr:unnamed protein product [Protopolystoma xenopodis]
MSVSLFLCPNTPGYTYAQGFITNSEANRFTSLLVLLVLSSLERTCGSDPVSCLPRLRCALQRYSDSGSRVGGRSGSQAGGPASSPCSRDSPVTPSRLRPYRPRRWLILGPSNQTPLTWPHTAPHTCTNTFTLAYTPMHKRTHTYSRADDYRNLLRPRLRSLHPGVVSRLPDLVCGHLRVFRPLLCPYAYLMLAGLGQIQLTEEVRTSGTEGTGRQGSTVVSCANLATPVDVCRLRHVKYSSWLLERDCLNLEYHLNVII